MGLVRPAPTRPILASPDGHPLLTLRAGWSLGFTVARDVTDRGEVPEYPFTDWDTGPEIGITIYPLRGRGRPDLGLFCDFYRGSRVYEDYLHSGDQAGRNYAIRMGLSHRIPWGSGT